MSQNEVRLEQVLIAIYRGVVYRHASEDLWDALIRHQGRVVDHVALVGLQLTIDESEGYAHLRQRPTEEGERELPRLVRRHQLSYPVSLLVVLLRKRLLEHDAHGSEARLVMTASEIQELLEVFLPESSDEAKTTKRVSAHITKVADIGFLREIRGQKGSYEVLRIIKSFVDAQLLSQVDDKLAEYRRYAEDENK